MGKLTDTGGHAAERISDIGIRQTRLVTGTSKCGKYSKTLEITRTERDFVYDLCDAYNRAMEPAARQRGLEYYVANGELRMGDSFEAMQANTRRIESRKRTESARALRNELNAQQ